MNELALKPGAYAQVRVREPAGERTFGPALVIGGEGAEVVVPGAPAGGVLRIDWRDRHWVAEPEPNVSASVRLNGRPLTAARELRRGDVLAIGEAHVIATDLTRTLLKLEVQHLVGNDTIAPVGTVASLGADGGDEELEIRVAIPAAISTEPAEPSAAPALAVGMPTRWWLPATAVVVVLAAFLFFISAFVPVRLDIQPEDAELSTPGTFFAMRFDNRLYVLPGEHTVRGEREGYEPGQASLTVTSDSVPTLRLRLAKLPGTLAIETGGVPVSVRVDGVEVGRGPGEVQVPAGRHTITLSAERYLDHVTTMEVEGAGVRQELTATLQPSWGKVQVTSDPPGALVSIDDGESGPAPITLDAPSGVRRVKISAPGFKTWESSVVVKAGETLQIGPVKLGQPDAQLTIRSRPAGADVSVGGTYRGKTPLTIALPAGVSHDIVATLPGHTDWRGSVFAESGRTITRDIRLEPILARVSIHGEPADAELFVDGQPRGRTPQTLELTAIQHKIEVRKEGFQNFSASVTPAVGLERMVEYKLIPEDRALALQQTAPMIKTQTGYVLKLIPPGTFKMGSDRREQGRRPNEGFRQVTLKRPFYIGVREVTNREFRQFRPNHASGYLGNRTVDLDDHPVSNVSWEDAAAYCNWLSEREGLVPAYESKEGTYVLKRPVPNGYRLPTEAEWEYAARLVKPGQMRRFVWGDALPVAPNSGNIAGAEAKELLEVALESYKDDYPVVAPAGKFEPNAIGLHDLSGNVSEWVNDYYLSYVDPAAVTDPLGPEQAGRHVIRGANWQTANVSELRLAWRDSGDGPSQTVGFRIARYAE